MTQKIAASACLCLALLVTACASAQPRHGPGGGRRGPGPDGAGPPRVSLFISPAGEPFRGADPRQMWLRQVDPTSSGIITIDAFVADARRYFDVLDLDGNGVIAGAEVTHYENDTVPEILAGGGGLQGAARFSLLNDPQPIRSADFDLDFRVTLAEYERKARETFARLDANHDGVLQVSELPPPPSAGGARRPGGARQGAPSGGRRGGGGRGGRGGGGGGGMGGPGGY